MKKHQFVPIGDNDYARRMGAECLEEYRCRYCGAVIAPLAVEAIIRATKRVALCPNSDANSTPEEDAEGRFNCLWNYDAEEGGLGFV